MRQSSSYTEHSATEQTSSSVKYIADFIKDSHEQNLFVEVDEMKNDFTKLTKEDFESLTDVELKLLLKTFRSSSQSLPNGDEYFYGAFQKLPQYEHHVIMPPAYTKVLCNIAVERNLFN
ncbi:hypothetical protein K8B83_18895 [Shewanella inventionis]|uniref:hypothetical protein n=1 Tax=Shewanella inventionis TaxID=1738770 RepID=UPI001CBEFDBB|nr:hypothetical protein [Shewanella inventionis]UAL42860.1 hypothetical protein K8B83_18895 [Shewanella inventionis]